MSHGVFVLSSERLWTYVVEWDRQMVRGHQFLQTCQRIGMGSGCHQQEANGVVELFVFHTPQHTVQLPPIR
jgi:hypothetical protein